jgi:hypothetical protein
MLKISFSIVIWTQDIGFRIQSTTPAPSPLSTSINLFGARDSYQSFQIVVQASPYLLQNVNMVSSALSNCNGSIAASSVVFYSQYQIDMSKRIILFNYSNIFIFIWGE